MNRRRESTINDRGIKKKEVTILKRNNTYSRAAVIAKIGHHITSKGINECQRKDKQVEPTRWRCLECVSESPVDCLLHQGCTDLN